MVLEELLVVVGIALSAACIAALLLLPNRTPHALAPDAVGEPLMLMFVQGDLHHATHAALSRFALLPGMHTWEDVRQTLRPRFPELPAQSETGVAGSLSVTSQDPTDKGVAELNWRDGICWLQVHEPPVPASGAAAAPQMPEAVKLCCDTMEDAAWEVLPCGAVGWRNHACDRLLARLSLPADTEPFDMVRAGMVDRKEVAGEDDQSDWYDVETFATPTTRIRIARCVTGLVRSEAAQRSFVQTLSATFAHLSIGLAIFEKNGQLSIFNPALLDLTGLPPTALVTRPTVLSFFDQLRENRCMPEPKNYGSWRQEINEMVTVAAEGCFQETWTLEDGRTFSVTGRPHAEGGTAFMFEDISSEVTLTRNFRIEMAQYEILLDVVADAMVVFSGSGVLTFCNAAYRQLWGHNPEGAFADVTIADAVDLWQDKLGRGIDWSGIIRTVNSLGQRQPLKLRLEMADGRVLHCVTSPVGSDATLVRFTQRDGARMPDTAAMR